MPTELPSRRKQADEPAPPTKVALPSQSKLAKPKVIVERSTPESREAEMGVLGSILKDPANALPEVVQAFRSPAYFYNSTNQTIFQCLCDMWDSGQAVDFITLTQYLRDQKLLDQVGGPHYVTELFTFVPTAANVQFYIDIVRQKYVLRRMIGLGTSMTSAAYGLTDEAPADLLRTFTGSFDRLLEDCQGTAFYDATTVLNGEQPVLPRQIIRHLLHEGSKMIVGGTSKSRKTWALMDLALSVATGTDWWGFLTAKSRVCYINLEIQDAFFIQRLRSLREFKNVQPEEHWLKILNLRGQAEAIEDLRKRFSLLLKSGYFKLVIIDPVYKVLGQRRDENKAGDIATLLNEIERIAVDTGAAVAFAAHFSKGNQAMKESIDRIGGSGVFARDPDTVLTMTAHEDLDCFTVEATLRNLPPIASFVVHWDYPTFGRDEERNPQRLKGTAGVKPTFADKDVLDHMSIVNGWATDKLQKHLFKERNMSRATFYRILGKLDDSGKIKKGDDGLWFRVSQSEQNESETTPKNSVSELL